MRWHYFGEERENESLPEVIYDCQLAQTHAHKPACLEMGFDALFVDIRSQCLAWIKNSLVYLFLFNLYNDV